MLVAKTNFRYRRPLIPLDLNKVEYIFIHHPAWAKATPQMIHDDVLNDPAKSDWRGFPYNEYIRKDGTVYIGRGDYIGAQVAGYNSVSYGISCEGNYDVEEMPEAQLKSLIERCNYHINRLPNKVKVLPHNALGKTSCPGKYFPMLKLYEGLEELKVDKKLQEAKAFLKKYGESSDHEYLVYRLKEIYENAFESDNIIRETLKSYHDIGTEATEIIYKFTKQQLRDLFKRRG